ncbi:hypothetical protein LguiA_010158 [Lonicera macranthoides]
MQKKMEQMEKWEGTLCPRVVEKLEANKMQYKYWMTTFNGFKEFEVRNGVNGYVVDFTDMTYSCRLWELSGIPCPHAVSVIYYMKRGPEKYMSSWYNNELTRKAYAYYLKLINREMMWKKTHFHKFLPPMARRMPGRPKNNRSRELHEDLKKNPSEISRKSRRMKCNKYGEYGHNQRTCRMKRLYRSNKASGSQCGVGPSTTPTRPPKYPMRMKQSLCGSQGGPSTALPTMHPRKNLLGKQGTFYQANKGPVFTKQPSGFEARSSKSLNKMTQTKRVNRTTGVASNTRSKTLTKEPVASAIRPPDDPKVIIANSDEAEKSSGTTQPLAIVFPHSSSNGEKLAIGHSKEIIPLNSNSVITIRKPTNKSSTTSAPFLTLSSKHERRTCVEDKQKSSTGCNGRKRLSNIDLRIINEKPTDTTSDSRSDSSKEAIEDSNPGSKLIEGPDADPNNIDISNSVSKEDKKITSTRRVKAQETTASSTTPTATTSLLELLYNRQENTKIPRSKRNIRVQLPNEVQKAKEPGRNFDPMSQKRRKICLNSPVLEGTKALAILHDDEANGMAENVKTLHCPTLLDDLTVVELRAIAKQRGMTGYSKLRKVDLARKLGMKLNHRGGS